MTAVCRHTHLFAYGTLCVPMFRRALLGVTAVLGPARLMGHDLRCADGYVFARPVHSKSVGIDGLILQLDARQLRWADAWEDLSVYERVLADDLESLSGQPAGVVSATAGSGELWFYRRCDIQGAPARTGEFTRRSGHEVLEAIAHTLATGSG